MTTPTFPPFRVLFSRDQILRRDAVNVAMSDHGHVVGPEGLDQVLGLASEPNLPSGHGPVFTDLGHSAMRLPPQPFGDRIHPTRLEGARASGSLPPAS